AREHLTTEMCLHIVQRFTDGYATDSGVRESVDSREIWVVPMANPDGSTYDIASGQYQGWRKNRQDSGTDLNRNWGYKWGCCGGASDNPSSETYRGSAPFSAPETAALRDFVNSRVVDGTQQIKAAIDFHTYSELVLWPFGHTTEIGRTAAPTSTATGATSGAAAVGPATTPPPRPTGGAPRSRPRRPPRCATSSTRGWSTAPSRSRPRSTSTPTPSWCCGRSGTPPTT